MSSSAKKLLAGLLTAGAALFASAPSALAGPLPDPEPAPPVGPIDGVPDPAPAPNGQIDVSAPEVAQVDVAPGFNGVPADSVPNINGDPCLGGWESVVCYAEQQGDSPVVQQPRTSISSSP